MTELLSRQEALKAGTAIFYLGTPCKYGHLGKRYVNSGACVECTYNHTKKFRTNHPEYMIKHVRKWEERNYKKLLIRRAEYRSASEITITEADIDLPSKCPCCGQQIDYIRYREQNKRNGTNANSPSLDRVDSSKGYIKGNVAVICWDCNNRKKNSTIPQLEAIIAYMRAFMGPRFAP